MITRWDLIIFTSFSNIILNFLFQCSYKNSCQTFKVINYLRQFLVLSGQSSSMTINSGYPSNNLSPGEQKILQMSNSEAQLTNINTTKICTLFSFSTSQLFYRKICSNQKII